MLGTRARIAGLCVLATTVALGGSTWPQRAELRVCADPDNMPFSNERSEGYENRIAQLVAADLGDSLVNVWWPHRRGFVRNTIRAGLCDLIIGVPKGFDPVLTTKPYFRSTYYFVYRGDRNLHIQSLDDTLLRHLKIGVNLIGYDYTNTPPAHALSSRGLVNNVVGFYTVSLTLVALPDSDPKSGMPFAFDITMAVRRSDKAFGAQIDSLLERRRGEIRRILQDFNVPTTDGRP
jgi:mxaJ protein